MAWRAQFGEAVRRAIGDRPYRSIAPLADVSPAYIADMVQGRVPKPEKVIALARATNADQRELLDAAGYWDWQPPWDPDKAFMDGFRALVAEFAADVEISAEDLQLARASPQGVAAALEAIRARFEERRRGG